MKEVEKRTGLDLEAAPALKARVEDRYARKDVVNRTVVVKVENEDFSPSPDTLLDIKTKLIGDRTLLSVKYGNWHTDTARREYEVNIDREDLASLFAILELLGYSRFIVLSTVRTTWSGDSVVITLDEYPKLGKALLEVELEDAGQGEAAIDAVFASLDVNPMDPQQTVEFISSLNQAKETHIDLGQVAPEELAQELIGSH
jgi:adenylate cyclase class IV